MESQAETGGFVPVHVEESAPPAPSDELDEDTTEREEEEMEEKTGIPKNLKHQSIAIRPLTFGNWMFDVVADLTGNRTIPSSNTLAPPPVAATMDGRASYRISRYVPFNSGLVTTEDAVKTKKTRPTSIQVHSPTSPSFPSPAYTLQGQQRRYSLGAQWTPTSTTFTMVNRSTFFGNDDDDEEDTFNKEKDFLKQTGDLAMARGQRSRRDLRRVRLEGIKVESPSTSSDEKKDDAEASSAPTGNPPLPFFALIKRVYPLIPSKPVLFLGLTICVLSGAMTPIFSFLLSRLLFEVSVGASNVSVINKFGGIVLAVAALDGLLIGTKFVLMEGVGMNWITKMRKEAFSRVLMQDRRWFDGAPAPSATESSESSTTVSSNTSSSPSSLVQILVKDADDARNFISIVWGQCLVVTAMLGVGLIWALVQGWQLTLAGLAIAPVFAGVMSVQTRLVAVCEGRNKRARESVARGYYDAIINIRGIRTMAFEGTFKQEFNKSADLALRTGVKGAFVEGCTYGVSSGLIYLAEAMLFYVGAVLISKGLYTYLQMVEVLNLVVFSVTIGSQLMAFSTFYFSTTRVIFLLIFLYSREDHQIGSSHL